MRRILTRLAAAVAAAGFLFAGAPGALSAVAAPAPVAAAAAQSHPDWMYE